MSIYLGETIKKLRKERELTQENLASFLGVSYQSISKWERGESFPDVTLIPSIASFFGVTIDELFGTDKSKHEEKIEQYIEEYETLCLKDLPAALEMIKTAVKEFPGEFRLLIRYMAALLSEKGKLNGEPKKIFDEMYTINETIQNHCVSDSIRIKAKRLMGTYYKTLSCTEKDDSYIEKMEEINKDLPVMRDSRDFTATHMYLPGEKHNAACRKAIEELVYLLDCATTNYCYFNDDFTPESKIKAAETMLAVTNTIYTDGNYGESWHTTVYNHGYIGLWYHQMGKNAKALEYLRKCAELSKKYDEMPQETTHGSLLFEGKVFEKAVRGKTMCERMKHHFTVNYPLSDEFKASEEFKNILEILG
ncbi:MAG: helix-turn-helix transcriptional regulator [Clostridia bacterium]|nr:helix-turn-helix transcriptional regulator [Clostridia bacterium]